MGNYLLDAVSVPAILPLELVNHGSAWDDSRIDLVIPWHLSVEHLADTTHFHARIFNIVFLLPSNSVQVKQSFTYRTYNRGNQHTEAAFFSYLKTSRRFALLLWGDELILEKSFPLLGVSQDQARQHNYVFLAKKIDVVCGYPLRPYQHSYRGGSLDTLVYDPSDLHCQLKPHHSSNYVVDFKLLHFSAVGLEGAVKTASNSLNEYRLRGGFSFSYFMSRFIKSELLNLVLLPFRVPLRLWPLSISLKMTTFCSACFLFVYRKYANDDLSDEPLHLYESSLRRLDKSS